MSEKKYYWLKLKRDFFKRHDIRIIEAMPNGKDYILFYLKLLCESVDHEGNLRFSEQIPYNEEMLATITNTNIDVVRSAIKIFSQLNMMEIMDDGTFFMSEVDRMIGCETEWARKKREYNKRKELKRKMSTSIEENVHPNEDNFHPNEENVHPKEENVLTISDKSKSIEKEKEKEKELELERKSRKKERPLEDVLGDVPVIVSNEDLKEAFLAFIEMRKKIKAPMTERALKMLVNETYKLGQGKPELMKAILNQSILHDWKGVYALKTDIAVSQTETENPFNKMLKNTNINPNDFDVFSTTPITREEIIYLLGVLKGAYPHARIQDPNGMVDAWVLAFSNNTRSEVYMSARYHMSKSKFFPTPADILDNLNKARIMYSEQAEQDTSPKLTSGQDEEEDVQKIINDLFESE